MAEAAGGADAEILQRPSSGRFRMTELVAAHENLAETASELLMRSPGLPPRPFGELRCQESDGPHRSPKTDFVGFQEDNLGSCLGKGGNGGILPPMRF